MGKFISNQILRALLADATLEQRLTLTQLIDPDRRKPFSSLKLQKEISLLGGHSVANFFRGGGTGYLDILDDIANKLEIEGLVPYYGNTKGLSVASFDEIEVLQTSKKKAALKGIEFAQDVEKKIALKVLGEIYKRMTPEERKSFNNVLNEQLKNDGVSVNKTLAGTAGLLALGNLGGFATYTFLTTTMSAISMGTLSFGAYTAATTGLSILLGPIGWIGLGLASLYHFGKGDVNKLIPIVIEIGMIRQSNNSKNNLEHALELLENEDFLGPLTEEGTLEGFLYCLAPLIAIITNANGNMSDDKASVFFEVVEKAVTQGLEDTSELKAAQLREGMNYLKLCLKEGLDESIYVYAFRFRSSFKYDKKMCKSAYETLFRITSESTALTSDENLTPEQDEIFRKLPRHLGLPDSIYDACKNDPN